MKFHNRFYTNTGTEPFACKHCNKRFTVISNLIHHERTHTGEKPYECTSCDKKFRQVGHLKKHEKSHTVKIPLDEKSFSIENVKIEKSSDTKVNEKIKEENIDEKNQCFQIAPVKTE